MVFFVEILLTMNGRHHQIDWGDLTDDLIGFKIPAYAAMTMQVYNIRLKRTILKFLNPKSHDQKKGVKFTPYALYLKPSGLKTIS
ncbi:hypothetical protein ASE92_08990 [Pedobacter sp. Leaf41]|nr:hypothetical protein ASE92_08990 [Pedobacter sp. Leaf41]